MALTHGSGNGRRRMVSYRYGIIGRPVIPVAVVAQLQLVDQMRNALVDIEHVHDTAVKEVWARRVSDREADLGMSDHPT
ncbi:hypothetical protein GCM10023322_30040 [Rugosimonospora acidiphila]|uniref:Uncharacterized protein n=1 Tax=Rugosimonospora acidiphila TaxID=556531 RepID=A0ABP9RT30_9ACTN